jgi:hypothetical protein
MNSTRKRKNSVPVMIAPLVLLGVLVSACSIDNWAEIEPGEYVALDASPATLGIAAQSIDRLVIDRDQRMMVVTMFDGTEIAAPFVPRRRTEWPSGCPTNINSTRMEVLDIVEDPLVIGEAAFSDPVLVRDCPRDPVRIVLRADGEIGGGVGACPHLEPCIYFGPPSAASHSPVSLPRAPKGYELYSWQESEQWHFTLLTGTNRLKTYEEIVSVENVVSESESVRLTVQGLESLEATLGRLPEGETVTWISAEWLERVGATQGNIQLPDPTLVQEIERHCQRLGIRLQIAG